MKTKQNNTIHPSHEVERLSKELYRKSELHGKKQGKNNLPSKQELQNPSYIQTIQGACGQVFSRIYRALSKDMEEIKTSFHQLKEEYMHNDITAHVKRNIRSLRAQWGVKNKQVTDRYNAQRTEKQSEIAELNASIKKEKIELDGTIYYPVKKKKIKKRIAVGIIFLGELWMNFQAISNFTRGMGIASLIMALAMGGMYYALGKQMVKSWNNQQTFISNIVSKWYLVAGALILSGFLAYLRSKVEAESIIAVPMWATVAINMVFFACIALSESLFAPSQEILEGNDEHDRIKKLIAKYKGQVAQLQTQIETSYAKEQKELEGLNTHYKKLIDAEKSDYNAKYDQLKEYQIKHNQLLQRGLELHKELVSVAMECASVYVNECNTYRSDGLVVANQNVVLDNPLAQYEIIHDHHIKNLFINLN